MSPSTHDLPSRLASVNSTSLVSATQTLTSHDDDGDRQGGAMLYSTEDTYSGDQGLAYVLRDEEGLEMEDYYAGDEGDYDSESGVETEEQEEDGDDEGSDDEVAHHTGHHSCPIHQSPYQSSYYQDMDEYFSDHPDIPDDAGAPLVGNLIAHLFTDGVDMDLPHAPPEGHPGFSWVEDEDDASSSESDYIPDPGVAAAAQEAVMEAHAQPAAFVAIGVPPAPLPFHPPPMAPGAFWTHAFSLSNPNPPTIGSFNLGLTDFLHHWADQSRILQNASRSPCPWPSRVNALQDDHEDEAVEFEDLEGDLCDFQGINWDDIGVRRKEARERRLLTFSNYTNIAGSDRWMPNLPDLAVPRKDSFFRFRRMDIKRDIHLSHFQLRHVFASASRSRVFYPSVGGVQQFNPLSGHGRAVMKISDALPLQFSTLAAGHGVLVAGGFGGEYTLRHLDSGEPEKTACHEGVITSNVSGITNHVDVHQSRTSSAPLAVFASNDNGFRVMDISTETWLSREMYDFAPNCSALSPDGRLRVVVGDSLDVMITAAEPSSANGKPDILQKLSGHRDYGFACDWADDGWTVATAFQDKTVRIWDARRFTDSSGKSLSVSTIRSEMAGVRSLRFSPIGSGKRVLVAAEEADFINIIDAETFRSKQTIDVFGELCGVSFENGGQDLMVLCSDRHRGGILQFERCGAGDGFAWSSDEEVVGYREQHGHDRVSAADWPPSMFTEAKRAKGRWSGGRREASTSVELEPF